MMLLMIQLEYENTTKPRKNWKMKLRTKREETKNIGTWWSQLFVNIKGRWTRNRTMHRQRQSVPLTRILLFLDLNRLRSGANRWHRSLANSHSQMAAKNVKFRAGNPDNDVKGGWCSTKVDGNGIHVPGNYEYCNVNKCCKNLKTLWSSQMVTPKPILWS